MSDLVLYFSVIEMTNPWLVGIGVWAVTQVAGRLIKRLSRTRKKTSERQKKVEKAHQEVLQTLRTSLTQNFIPTPKVGI